MNKVFDDKGFADYVHWQNQDRKTLNKINRLLQSIERDGAMYGEGKPERLKYGLGYSRRIDESNRLIYDIDEQGYHPRRKTPSFSYGDIRRILTFKTN